MAIIDLTGTSWQIKTSPSLSSSLDMYINFTSDGYSGRNYTRIRRSSSTIRYYYSSTGYTTVYSSSWTSTGYRTIHITGGTDATNSTLITWLQNNATQIEYTVSFAMNGHGTQIASQTVQEGNTASKPSPDPTTSGWVFGGWYNESACTTEFDFSTAITADKTLYAKWTEPVVNKVVYNNTVLIDLTSDTATQEDVLQGKYFHLADGRRVQGTRGAVEIPSWATGTAEQIQTALAAHYAEKIDLTDYWSVGDTRTVTLPAMPATSVSETHASQSVELVLMDSTCTGFKFTHNNQTPTFIVGMKNCLAEAGTNGDKVSIGWYSSNRKTWCDTEFRQLWNQFCPIFLSNLLGHSGIWKV